MTTSPKKEQPSSPIILNMFEDLPGDPDDRKPLMRDFYRGLQDPESPYDVVIGGWLAKEPYWAFNFETDKYRFNIKAKSNLGIAIRESIANDELFHKDNILVMVRYCPRQVTKVQLGEQGFKGAYYKIDYEIGRIKLCEPALRALGIKLDN